MTNKKTNYKGFYKIDKVLGVAAKNYKLEHVMHKHRTLKHWHGVASGFIEEASNLTQAIDFKKGILIVACLTKEIASKVRLFSERIIYALNQALGKQLVFGIHVEV